MALDEQNVWLAGIHRGGLWCVLGGRWLVCKQENGFRQELKSSTSMKHLLGLWLCTQRKEGRKATVIASWGVPTCQALCQPWTSDSSFNLTTVLQGRHRVILSISQIRNLNLKEVKGLLLVNGRAKV